MASRVPTTTQVIPGASVSIVLKADQGTGREVQGVVRDVLTRGNHHRGIKVRLADGRIGRVQRLAARPADGSSSNASDSTGSGIPLTEEHGQEPSPQLRNEGRQRPRYRDVRLDDQLEAPSEQIDLGAYIVAPKRKNHKGRRKAAENESTATDPTSSGEGSNANLAADVVSATVTCPVCSIFEGDEAAVAHHVATHFE